jgi:hypothetical protein
MAADDSTNGAISPQLGSQFRLAAECRDKDISIAFSDESFVE